MFAALNQALRQLVQTGNLTVTDNRGRKHVYGDGTGKPTGFRIVNPRAPMKILLDPDRYFGELYMNGDIELTEGTVYDLLEVLLQNVEQRPTPGAARFFNKIRIGMKRLDQYNPVGKAKANVAHHYDLSGALYDLFLDRDRQYSCAYFETPESSLEDAQLAKKRHLAAKLNIKPGMKVLDIGSGWGGLGLYLAETCGAKVTGVTLSEEQLKMSMERARQRSVSNTVDFRLLDYRLLDEPFDRIVSVGMFEHVGVGHYPEFFQKCRALLKDDGVAVLHSINRSDGPGATSAWIKKYIFPGGYIPALSEVLPHIEKNGLYVTDIEILRLHYAKTLHEWGKLFAANRHRAKAIYDERFCRMWEFYLAAAETTFRYGGMNNFQIQFTRSQHVLPMTRNYMITEEERLRAVDSKSPRLKSVPAE
ncbi:MAG TPA: cyclopropane-fatty-acyl-phospholipid synthase family protein [Nordella sp.]|nr:cyclopropane-fatty-acyl-phospholipid synthase family protein [Nordella sp.]